MGKNVSRKMRDGLNGQMYYWCPGCRSLHVHPYNTGVPGRDWSYNGNPDKPSFTPSMLINKDFPEKRCHYYLTDGVFHYCSDCHHGLKDKQVPMVDLPSYLLGEDEVASG